MATLEIVSKGKVFLWLDDIRPAPEGWVWVDNIEEAKMVLSAFDVEEFSMDHDLGACQECLGDRTADQWLVEHNFESMPHCEHVGTGYDLLLWMTEYEHWPNKRPTVHSANPVGRERMQGVIDRYYKVCMTCDGSYDPESFSCACAAPE